MKHFIYLLAFTLVSMFITNSALAQGLAVNTTGVAADASAMLDVASASKGVLVPRMTAAQKASISSPAIGLLIFQTDGTPGFYYYTGSAWSTVGGGGSSLPSGTTGDLLHYNGSSWVRLPAGANGTVLVVQSGIPTWVPTLPVDTSGVVTIAVGSMYGGGVIAYMLQPGDVGYDAAVPHGLIAAISDQGPCMWYNGGYYSSATGTALGTGLANTNAIIDIQGPGEYAAATARAYGGGGYSDWYLPSLDELHKLYINRVAIGGFRIARYWSSSQFDLTNARFELFTIGFPYYDEKSFLYRVRPIRSF